MFVLAVQPVLAVVEPEAAIELAAAVEPVLVAAVPEVGVAVEPALAAVGSLAVLDWTRHCLDQPGIRGIHRFSG